MTYSPYWNMEHLEPRQMLSAKHGHHHGKTAVAPLSTPVIAAAPAPASVKRRHAAAAAVFPVEGGLLGTWSGGLSGTGNFFGEISLTVYQGSEGMYAVLRLDRPGGAAIVVQSQFRVASDGTFSLAVLTPKLALRFSGTIFNHQTRTSPLPTMNGSVQYWDRGGNFKGDFVLSPQRQLQG